MRLNDRRWGALSTGSFANSRQALLGRRLPGRLLAQFPIAVVIDDIAHTFANAAFSHHRCDVIV